MAPSLPFRKNDLPKEGKDSTNNTGSGAFSRLLRRKASVKTTTSTSPHATEEEEEDIPSSARSTSTIAEVDLGGPSSSSSGRYENGNGYRRGSEPAIRSPRSTEFASSRTSPNTSFKRGYTGGDGVIVIGADSTPLPANHPLIPDHALRQRASFAKPEYPTALSPPRTRRVPASRNFSTPDAESDNAVPASSIMGHDLSALGGRRASTPNTRGTDEGLRPSLTPEWLSRRPSSRSRLASNDSFTDGNGNGTGTGTGHGDGNSNGKVSPLRRKRPILDAPVHLRNSRSSSTSADESSLADVDGESDAEIRRPNISTLPGGYEVEISCADERIEDEEIRWSVVIRRQPRSNSSTTTNPTPLQLSTTTSRTSAPPSASSLNLSLSLDAPTGKLVFISFPTDLHATPRRRPSASSGTPPPRLTTPPPQPSTPQSRRKTTVWSPSPRTSGGSSNTNRKSPPASPGPVFTPRRIKMVNAAQLDGGLYARGTVDGLSEDLEHGLDLRDGRSS